MDKKSAPGPAIIKDYRDDAYMQAYSDFFALSCEFSI
jgi:hypothetical protein